jgi:hypothetical protein
MTVSAVLILVVVFMVLLRTYLVRRRRTIRRQLLRSGTRVPATVVAPPGRGDATARKNSGVILVRYTSGDGVERYALKQPVSRLDSWMSGEPAAVLYDPRRPGDGERILVGFGRTEKTWFRVRLRPAAKSGD